MRMTGPLRVLELGSYVVPAYAGMILAEQGHLVTKWIKPGADPILACNHGERLWEWINKDKKLEDRHPREVCNLGERFDVIIDNFLPQTLKKWSIEPAQIAGIGELVWVSMRSEVKDHESRSFDIIAQARSTMSFAPWAPYWMGDTAGGLWVAFKALSADSMGDFGHHKLYQASCLQKLVEGELMLGDVERSWDSVPWEKEPYRQNGMTVEVGYKGHMITEPIRDFGWKWDNLKHKAGRIIV